MTLHRLSTSLTYALVSAVRRLSTYQRKEMKESEESDYDKKIYDYLTSGNIDIEALLFDGLTLAIDDNGNIVPIIELDVEDE